MKTKRIIPIVAFILTALLLTSCKKEAANDTSEVSSYTSAATSSSLTASSNKNDVNSQNSTVTSSFAHSSDTSEVSSYTFTSSNMNDVNSQDLSNTPSSTTTSSTMSSVKSTTSSSISEPAISSVADTPSSNTTGQEWTETEYIMDLYVWKNNVKSRVKPIEGSNIVKEYNKDDKVHVVARTDTMYYKLEDGSFIHCDFLSVEKIESPSNGDVAENNSQQTNKDLIPLTREVPDNASEETKTNLQQNEFRELWNLNIGDTTSTGYKVIGKTPEGFGYIGVEEDSEITGYYIAYYDEQGDPCYVCDEAQNKEYWNSLNFNVTH